MDVRLSPGAKKYIEKHGIECLVLNLVELETGCTLGVAKDVEVSFAYPQKPTQFLWGKTEGVEVFVDRRLKVTGTVAIKKQGIGRFSCLFADGVGVPI
jgi:hypothetical protein